MKSPLSPRSPFSGIIRRARSLTFDSIVSPRSRRGSNAHRVAFMLPPELWDKVFLLLPRYQMKSIATVCRVFRSLAQPILFSTISTHPDALPALAVRGAQTGKYRKRLIERLEFLFSQRIGPAIRECRVAPPSAEDDGSDDILDYIFATLPDLPNLRILECRYVRLTPKRLAVLQNLQLTTISLEMCFGDISDFTSSYSVSLQTVSFKYPDSTPRPDKASPCLLFLSPTHLEQLLATTTQVLSIMARSQSFSKLRYLTLPVESLASHDLIPALSRCPAVEQLKLTTTTRIPHSLFESLPDGVLPRLNSYGGPHHFAPILLRGRDARRVSITIPGKPHRLETTLVELDRKLKSLSFLVDSTELPPQLLETVHTRFSSLSALAISEPALSSADIKAVMGAVSSSYSVQHLMLRIAGRDKHNLWVPPDEADAAAVSCLKKVQATLLQTYPALQTVRFVYGVEGLETIWHRLETSGLFI
ncbi:hypothetical protein C8J57DRAFT_1356047 [Mycena rebaudengoi]|nr:hypothetical protein C8J57DRAFT_1356047 [Mycena rebaudengoi]